MSIFESADKIITIEILKHKYSLLILMIVKALHLSWCGQIPSEIMSFLEMESSVM